jgi:energy-coupling factor transport system substrate-specific component
MSRVVFWAASISGAGLFLWPLLGLGPPGTGVALAVAVGAVGAMIALEAGSRRLDSRRLALLATLAAIDAGLRLVLVTGIEGFSPIFFLILCAGYAFGPSFGFMVGGMSLLVSALATGGVGPWLPFQVFAAGWVGAAAGLLSGLSGSVPGRTQLAILALFAGLCGFAFGIAMDTWDWTTYYRGAPDFGWVPGLDPGAMLSRFGRFYLATSLVYDSFRAVGNAVLVLFLGRPVIAALVRFRARFTTVLVP